MTPFAGTRQRSYIVQISDQHIPFPNSDAAAAYEMLHTTNPRIVLNVGDKVQMEPHDPSASGSPPKQGSKFPLTMPWIVYLDLANQRRSRNEMEVLDQGGNHDLLIMTEKVAGSARKAGLNVAHIVITGDTVSTHGHDNDSLYVNEFLNLVCSSQSSKLVSQSAHAAKVGHTISKRFLAAQDYERSFADTPYRFGCKNYSKGHDHNPRVQLIYDPPFKSLRSRNIRKDLVNFALRHSVGPAKVIAPLLVKGIGSTVFQTKIAPQIASVFNSRAVKKPLTAIFGEKAVRMTGTIAASAMPILAAKPDVGILDKVDISRMKPPKQAFIFDGCKKILDVTKVVSSAWTEGLNTYQEIDQYGNATLKHWDQETRLSYGLPETPPTEDEIVAQHFAEFGGIHPKTIEQIEFYLNSENGMLGYPTTDEVERFSKFPATGEAWRIDTTSARDPVLVPPVGQAVQTIPMAEPIPMYELSAILACIDPHIVCPAGPAPERHLEASPPKRKKDDEMAGMAPGL